MSVGLWGCSIFRNSENRENPVCIGICMWILRVAFGRDSAARRPLAAARWLGATPQLPWCRWGERCGMAAPGLRAGRAGGWHLQTWPRVCLAIPQAQRRRPFHARRPLRARVGLTAAQAHRGASGIAFYAPQPRAADGAGPGPVCGCCVPRPPPSAHREFYAGDLISPSCHYHTHVLPRTGSISLLIASTMHL